MTFLPHLQVYDLLQGAFEKLNIDLAKIELERLTTLICTSMSHKNRVYHTLDHAIMVSGDSSPIAIFSGLFHDVVYVQVDEGVPLLLKSFFKNFTFFISSDGIWSGKIHTLDPWLEFVNRVFRFQIAQGVAIDYGLNEFLSAGVAYVYLSPWVSPVVILQVLYSIYFTIPFPKKTLTLDHLVHDFIKIGHAWGIELESSASEAIVHEACRFANRDVSNFAENSLDVFFKSSWQLILEQNPSLRGVFFTNHEWHKATLKMWTSFHRHKKDSMREVFRGGVEVLSQREQSAVNVEAGLKYFFAHVLASYYFLSIALLTGGDCPFVYFITAPQGVNITETDPILKSFETLSCVESLDLRTHAYFAYLMVRFNIFFEEAFLRVLDVEHAKLFLIALPREFKVLSQRYFEHQKGLRALPVEATL